MLKGTYISHYRGHGTLHFLRRGQATIFRGQPQQQIAENLQVTAHLSSAYHAVLMAAMEIRVTSDASFQKLLLVYLCVEEPPPPRVVKIALTCLQNMYVVYLQRRHGLGTASSKDHASFILGTFFCLVY